MNTWLRGKILNIAILICGLAVAFGAGEITVRAFLKDKINLFPRYHAAVQYGDYTLRRFLPNSTFIHTSVDGRWEFRINDSGFRDDRNHDHLKPAGVRRVLVLGDSHAAGFEVHREEMFTALLQDKLDGTGERWEVINTGVSGFGTAEQLVYLENEGFNYDPDIVVLALFRNDFSDSLKSGLFTLVDGELSEASRVHTPGMRVQNIINNSSILQWLSQNSYLYSFGFNALYQIAKKMLLSKARQEAATEYAIAVEDVREYEVEIVKALLKRMYSKVREHRASLIIVDIPRRAADGVLGSSVPEGMEEFLSTHSDGLLSSKVVFGAYPDPAVLHVPHGHRHISATAHNEIAGALFSFLHAPTAP